MFMNEAGLVSNIEHTNVVRITDIGFDHASPCTAMEYCASRTLTDVMLELHRREERLPVPLAAYVLCQCCAGLDSAHNQHDAAGKPLHIVHRDVTAKNIFIGYSGA